MLRFQTGVSVVLGVSLAGQASAAPPRQQVTGPVASYWMSAATTSGIMAGMAGMAAGGKRPGLGAIMGMMSGAMDPNAASKSLILQLGSNRTASGGAPTAEHDAPPTLGVGAVLPLLTPQVTPTQYTEPREPAQPQRMPKGRMLIFWGCGEHAGPGQPFVIDFATLGQGVGASRLAAMRGPLLSVETPPSPARNTTYGEWPNRETRKPLSGEASLQGAHVVRGNYTPDINFSLAADQDFLPPIHLTTNAHNPTGSATLAWNPVDGAKGYVASMIGAQAEQTMVMWTSSTGQTSAFGMPEYLSNGDIARLVASQALISSSQTSCVIPVEAVQAAGRGGFFTLAAYGGETILSYPPRPPAPKPWNIAWQVKVRYRSATSGMVGMTMGGDEGGRQRRPGQDQKPRKKSPFGGLINPLGGILP